MERKEVSLFGLGKREDRCVRAGDLRLGRRSRLEREARKLRLKTQATKIDGSAGLWSSFLPSRMRHLVKPVLSSLRNLEY